MTRSSAAAGSQTAVLDRRLQKADVLYRSPALVIGDVHCPLFHRGCGLEEHADAHTVLLVRTGLFTKTAGRDTVVADPNHVIFFTRHDPYRIAHPVVGGDTSTFLTLRTADRSHFEKSTVSHRSGRMRTSTLSASCR